MSWSSTKKNKILILILTKKRKKGLFLEVNLDYPKRLHNKHNDYPLAPKGIEIKNHMLSDYCKKFHIKVGRVNKLVPNLEPKKNYVLHYKNLKQHLDLGLKVTKVHRALEFNQSLG